MLRSGVIKSMKRKSRNQILTASKYWIHILNRISSRVNTSVHGCSAGIRTIPGLIELDDCYRFDGYSRTQSMFAQEHSFKRTIKKRFDNGYVWDKMTFPRTRHWNDIVRQEI